MDRQIGDIADRQNVVNGPWECQHLHLLSPEGGFKTDLGRNKVDFARF